MRPAVMRLALFVLALHLSALPQSAQAEPSPPALRLDTPSGLPVPRFVSLKDDMTNCRIGPSREHPIRYVFHKPGAPVLVIAESVDHWRKVRDIDGDECWAYKTTLKAQSHVMTAGETTLRLGPKADAPMAARLGARVLARIEKRKAGWVRIRAGDARGWVRSDIVWGGDALQEPAKPD